MPTATRSRTREQFRLKETVTPTQALLTVSGGLDVMACRVLEQKVRRLLAEWPEIELTLNFDHVVSMDEDAAEALLLTIVVLRAGTARLILTTAGGPFESLVERLGVSPVLPQCVLGGTV